jgi:agmatine deiminase
MTLRMPAEWEPHEATWLTWPHRADDWPDRFAPIPWVFGEVIRHLSRQEIVRLIVPPGRQAEVARFLARLPVVAERIEYRELPTDRCWTRDFAPIWTFDSAGLRYAVKWRFTAWARYGEWAKDDAAGQVLAQEYGPSVEAVWQGRPVVLEGGSIDVDGQGSLLTTEQCLLGPEQARNPGMTRADYEQVFAEYLGTVRVIWLKRGIAGDDTHGHVDDVARFVAPGTVVCAVEEDPGDENYEPLQENLELLRRSCDARGRPLQVVPLPMPSPLFFAGQRVPASYANFYIANGLVLVPTFNDERDRTALARLAELFPDRRVVGIYCGDLAWGLGTLHCLTMQQPRSRLLA